MNWFSVKHLSSTCSQQCQT